MWLELSQRNWMVLQISRESIPGSRCRKRKTSTTNVHSFTSRNKKLASRGRSEPETSLNCTNRNAMSCKISWCQSVQALVCHDTQFICYSLWESEPATVFSCGPWHSHDQEAARWVELQISKRTAVVWSSQLKIQQVRRYNILGMPLKVNDASSNYKYRPPNKVPVPIKYQVTICLNSIFVINLL